MWPLVINIAQNYQKLPEATRISTSDREVSTADYGIGSLSDGSLVGRTLRVRTRGYASTSPWGRYAAAASRCPGTRTLCGSRSYPGNDKHLC